MAYVEIVERLYRWCTPKAEWGVRIFPRELYEWRWQLHLPYSEPDDLLWWAMTLGRLQIVRRTQHPRTWHRTVDSSVISISKFRCSSRDSQCCRDSGEQLTHSWLSVKRVEGLRVWRRDTTASWVQLGDRNDDNSEKSLRPSLYSPGFFAVTRTDHREAKPWCPAIRCSIGSEISIGLRRFHRSRDWGFMNFMNDPRVPFNDYLCIFVGDLFLPWTFEYSTIVAQKQN